MSIDPDNPVMKLCAAGISAEMAGLRDEASKLYQEAWDAKTNDYEACIASHYLARLQKTPEESLHWNAEALRFAKLAADAGLQEFFPSLYLNLGKSHEDLNNFTEARRFYSLAERASGVLSDGEYAETVRRGIRRGLERVKSVDTPMNLPQTQF
ncbi:MAG TPA: hypothetical protein VGJ06_11615 [Candidatus Acidoferrum sp.]|jgi:hypothetical protein